MKTADEIRAEMERMRVADPVPRPRAPLRFDRSHMLPVNEYVPDEEPKDLICLHHTVGGSATSSINWWRQKAGRVGTAFVIARDGTIFVAFEPQYWAWHLGKGSGGADYINERRSIGIELANEGPLEMGEKGLLNSPVTKRVVRPEDAIDLGREWRSWRYFARYTEPQLDACIELVETLLRWFPGIPRQRPHDVLDYDARWRDFKGIMPHSSVRSVKSDVHPGFPWRRLDVRCELQAVDQEGRPATAGFDAFRSRTRISR